MNSEKKKEYLRVYREKNKKSLKEKQKTYREKNRELLKERSKIFKENNPEKIKEYNSKYKNSNRKKLREKDKTYRESHKEKRNGYNKKYYSENKDYFNEYYKEWLLNLNNEEKEKLKYQLRNGFHKFRAKTKATDITSDFLRKLYQDVNVCPLCGVEMIGGNDKPNSKNLDHIVPLKVEGEHIKSNIRIICKKCNQSRPKDGSDLKSN